MRRPLHTCTHPCMHAPMHARTARTHAYMLHAPGKHWPPLCAALPSTHRQTHDSGIQTGYARGATASLLLHFYSLHFHSPLNQPLCTPTGHARGAADSLLLQPRGALCAARLLRRRCGAQNGGCVCRGTCHLQHAVLERAHGQVCVRVCAQHTRFVLLAPTVSPCLVRHSHPLERPCCEMQPPPATPVLMRC